MSGPSDSKYVYKQAHSKRQSTVDRLKLSLESSNVCRNSHLYENIFDKIAYRTALPQLPCPENTASLSTYESPLPFLGNSSCVSPSRFPVPCPRNSSSFLSSGSPLPCSRDSTFFLPSGPPPPCPGNPAASSFSGSLPLPPKSPTVGNNHDHPQDGKTCDTLDHKISEPQNTELVLGNDDLNILKLFMILRRNGPVTIALAWVFRMLYSNQVEGMCNESVWLPYRIYANERTAHIDVKLSSVKEYCINTLKYSETKFKKIFSKDERETLTKDVNPLELDITLLYKLLQNTCGLADPNDSRWYSPSPAHRQCIEHALYLLKMHRNFLSHFLISLSDQEMIEKISSIKSLVEIIFRGVGHLTGCNLINECTHIKRLITNILTSSTHETTLSEYTRALRQERRERLLLLLLNSRQELQRKYEACRVVNPITWYNHHQLSSLVIEKVFTEVQMELNKCQVDLEDLLTRLTKTARDAAQVLLFLGASGSGKTSTCLHMLHAWCFSTITALCHFDLVLFIQCRYISTSSLEKFLAEDLIANSLEPFARDDIIPILRECRILFIVDGFEEAGWKARKLLEQVFTKVPHAKMIITLRTEYCEDAKNLILSRVQTDNCFAQNTIECSILLQVYLLGFSSEKVPEYVEKVFSVLVPADKKKHKTTSFLRYLGAVQNNLKDHFGVPLTLAFIAILWHEDEAKVCSIQTVSRLYQEIVQMHTCKMCERQSRKYFKNIHPEDLRHQCTNLLHKLGEKALESLQEGHLYLGMRDECEMRDFCNNLQLDPTESLSCFLECVPRVSYESGSRWTFTHKSIQEFLASKYILSATSTKGFISTHFQSIQAFKKLMNVSLFIMGLISTQARVSSEVFKDFVSCLIKTSLELERSSRYTYLANLILESEENEDLLELLSELFLNEQLTEHDVDSLPLTVTSTLLRSTNIKIAQNLRIKSQADENLLQLLHLLHKRQCSVHLIMFIQDAEFLYSLECDASEFFACQHLCMVLQLQDFELSVSNIKSIVSLGHQWAMQKSSTSCFTSPSLTLSLDEGYISVKFFTEGCTSIAWAAKEEYDKILGQTFTLFCKGLARIGIALDKQAIDIESISCMVTSALLRSVFTAVPFQMPNVIIVQDTTFDEDFLHLVKHLVLCGSFLSVKGKLIVRNTDIQYFLHAFNKIKQQFDFKCIQIVMHEYRPSRSILNSFGRYWANVFLLDKGMIFRIRKEREDESYSFVLQNSEDEISHPFLLWYNQGATRNICASISDVMKGMSDTGAKIQLSYEVVDKQISHISIICTKTLLTILKAMTFLDFKTVTFDNASIDDYFVDLSIYAQQNGLMVTTRKALYIRTYRALVLTIQRWKYVIHCCRSLWIDLVNWTNIPPDIHYIHQLGILWGKIVRQSSQSNFEILYSFRKPFHVISLPSHFLDKKVAKFLSCCAPDDKTHILGKVITIMNEGLKVAGISPKFFVELGSFTGCTFSIVNVFKELKLPLPEIVELETVIFDINFIELKNLAKAWRCVLKVNECLIVRTYHDLLLLGDIIGFLDYCPMITVDVTDWKPLNNEDENLHLLGMNFGILYCRTFKPLRLCCYHRRNDKIRVSCTVGTNRLIPCILWESADKNAETLQVVMQQFLAGVTCASIPLEIDFKALQLEGKFSIASLMFLMQLSVPLPGCIHIQTTTFNMDFLQLILVTRERGIGLKATCLIVDDVEMLPHLSDDRKILKELSCKWLKLSTLNWRSSEHYSNIKLFGKMWGKLWDQSHAVLEFRNDFVTFFDGRTQFTLVLGNLLSTAVIIETLSGQYFDILSPLLEGIYAANVQVSLNFGVFDLVRQKETVLHDLLQGLACQQPMELHINKATYTQGLLALLELAHSRDIRIRINEITVTRQSTAKAFTTDQSYLAIDGCDSVVVDVSSYAEEEERLILRSFCDLLGETLVKLKLSGMGMHLKLHGNTNRSVSFHYGAIWIDFRWKKEQVDVSSEVLVNFIRAVGTLIQVHISSKSEFASALDIIKKLPPQLLESINIKDAVFDESFMDALFLCKSFGFHLSVYNNLYLVNTHVLTNYCENIEVIGKYSRIKTILITLQDVDQSTTNDYIWNAQTKRLGQCWLKNHCGLGPSKVYVLGEMVKKKFTVTCKTHDKSSREIPSISWKMNNWETLIECVAVFTDGLGVSLGLKEGVFDLDVTDAAQTLHMIQTIPFHLPPTIEAKGVRLTQEFIELIRIIQDKSSTLSMNTVINVVTNEEFDILERDFRQILQVESKGVKVDLSSIRARFREGYHVSLGQSYGSVLMGISSDFKGEWSISDGMHHFTFTLLGNDEKKTLPTFTYISTESKKDQLGKIVGCFWKGLSGSYPDAQLTFTVKDLLHIPSCWCLSLLKTSNTRLVKNVRVMNVEFNANFLLLSKTAEVQQSRLEGSGAIHILGYTEFLMFCNTMGPMLKYCTHFRINISEWQGKDIEVHVKQFGHSVVALGQPQAHYRTIVRCHFIQQLMEKNKSSFSLECYLWDLKGSSLVIEWMASDSQDEKLSDVMAWFLAGVRGSGASTEITFPVMKLMNASHCRSLKVLLQKLPLSLPKYFKVMSAVMIKEFANLVTYVESRNSWIAVLDVVLVYFIDTFKDAFAFISKRWKKVRVEVNIGNDKWYPTLVKPADLPFEPNSDILWALCYYDTSVPKLVYEYVLVSAASKTHYCMIWNPEMSINEVVNKDLDPEIRFVNKSREWIMCDVMTAILQSLPFCVSRDVKIDSVVFDNFFVEMVDYLKHTSYTSVVLEELHVWDEKNLTLLVNNAHLLLSHYRCKKIIIACHISALDLVELRGYGLLWGNKLAQENIWSIVMTTILIKTQVSGLKEKSGSSFQLECGDAAPLLIWQEQSKNHVALKKGILSFVQGLRDAGLVVNNTDLDG